MVSGLWSNVLCVSCLVLVQAVQVCLTTDYCTSYWDPTGVFYDAQQCDKYCCGSCISKYCCREKKNILTAEQQAQCSSNSPYSIGVIVGITFAVVVPVVLFVTLIICCLSPECLIYKRCRKGHNQRQTIERNAPQSPRSPPGPQPAHGGYQSVPGREGLPMPSAPPPSYLEITEASAPQGQALHPLSEPQSPPPPYSDEPEQHPLNQSLESEH